MALLHASVWARTSALFLCGDYQSPIESRMAIELETCLLDGVRWQPQYAVDTRAGAFVLDFAIIDERGDGVIGIECDGADYHDPLRDAFRDAFILDAGRVGFVYRFSGSEIHQRDGILADVANTHPHLFKRLYAMPSRAACDFDPFGPRPRLFGSRCRAGFNRIRHPVFGMRYLLFADREGITDIDELACRWRDRFEPEKECIQEADEILF